MNWVPIKTALARIGRGIVSLAISAGVAYLTNDKRFIILAPVINGAGKFIRESLKLDNIPI